MAKKKVELKVVTPPSDNGDVAPIAKPASKFSLDKFKSKTESTIANVGTELGPLPCFKISDANDYVRLHHDEEAYWSFELCFVSVPIFGQKRDTLHLIDEELGMRFLSAKKIKRFRLALATKPNDVFFLCHIPTQNLDNSFNESSLRACQQAKTMWIEVTSRREEGVDSYKFAFARDQDAFPVPKWPSKSLIELIETSYHGRMIEGDNHPALLRLIGAKQSLS
jgi:hypothetical protein